LQSLEQMHKARAGFGVAVSQGTVQYGLDFARITKNDWPDSVKQKGLLSERCTQHIRLPTLPKVRQSSPAGMRPSSNRRRQRLLRRIGKEDKSTSALCPQQTKKVHARTASEVGPFAAVDGEGLTEAQFYPPADCVRSKETGTATKGPAQVRISASRRS
jgi:hypothetical protein